MTFIADLLEGGYWPLQHQDTRFHREFRIVRYACRTVEDTELHVPVPDRGSTGPVMGGFLWSTLDRQEQPPIWSFAAPCVRHDAEPRDAGLGASRTWGLEKAGDWIGTEPLLESRELVAPFEQKYPINWPGIALASVNPDIQNDLVMPGFAGLVAPHRAGDPELGTPVWDVDADGSLDELRRARLQSLCRVYRYPPAACVEFGAGLEPGGLAWQLGTARSGLAGAGVVADLGAGGLSTIERGTSAPQVLATASVRAGGPLHVGSAGDQHSHGTTPDGEVINSLHLSTSSLFLGHGGDAPLRFEGAKLPEESAPLVVPAHLRLDGAAIHRTPCGAYSGLWIFQAESFIAKIPDRFPPEDGEPLPPPTEPREPGDTVTSGADGWIALGGTPPQIAPLQQVRQLAGSPMELGVPALVFRPQSLNTSAADLRNLPPSLFDREAEKQWSEAPAVLRMEAAGVEHGPQWSRTTEPGKGRYAAGGTGDGVLWFMPPELGLELSSVSGLSTSSAELGLWSVDLTIASPSTTDAATAINGYRISNVSTAFSQRLQIDSLDANGADNHRIEIQGPNIITTGGMFQGDSLRLDDGSFYVTLEPAPGALTANRLAYIRDRTFYVGEHLQTNAISASGRIVTLRSYAVDCSGGAIALELPAATSANEGDEVEIIDSSGDAATNNITINRVGSDTIRGSTSYVIGSDYGVVRLRCGSSTWHVVGEVVT